MQDLTLHEVDRDYSSIIPDDPGDERDPDRDNFIDEVSAEVLAEQAKSQLGEGDVDVIDIWDDLPAAQKQALLQSEALAYTTGVKDRSARHIDWNVVPKHLHLRWISPALVNKGFGYRGYTPVRRTAITQSWVPNARQFGSQKVFVMGGAILCATPKRIWLARHAQELQSTSIGQTQEANEHVRAAISTLHKKLGISKSQAERLDREHDGIVMHRGPDPDGPGDRVTAEELENLQKPSRRSKARRGRSEG
jgi:hypothetical protein